MLDEMKVMPVPAGSWQKVRKCLRPSGGRLAPEEDAGRCTRETTPGYSPPGSRIVRATRPVKPGACEPAIRRAGKLWSRRVPPARALAGWAASPGLHRSYLTVINPALLDTPFTVTNAG